MAITLFNFEDVLQRRPYSSPDGRILGSERWFKVSRGDLDTYIPSRGDVMEGESAPLGYTVQHVSVRAVSRKSGMVWIVVRYEKTRVSAV